MLGPLGILFHQQSMRSDEIHEDDTGLGGAKREQRDANGCKRLSCATMTSAVWGASWTPVTQK